MAQKGIIKNTTAAEISAENLAAVFHAIVGKSGIVKGFKFSRFCKETIAGSAAAAPGSEFKFSRFCKETIAVANAGRNLAKFKFSRFCKETIARR